MSDDTIPLSPSHVEPPADGAPRAPEPTTESAAPRRGHGRWRRPTDLPRERVEIELTEAEKACPCCRWLRIRIGADVRVGWNVRAVLGKPPSS
jgi:hypothetical protein